MENALPVKRLLIKEIVKMVDTGGTKNGCKEIKIVLPDGSEIIVSIRFKEKRARLSLVRNG